MGDLPSTFINVPHGPVTFRHFPSTFRAAEKPSFNVHQLFVQASDLPSPSIKLLCSQVTFCQLSPSFRAARRPSINFPCTGRPSVNFQQLSVCPGDLLISSIYFLCSKDNLRQHSVQLWDLPWTLTRFCAIGRPSIHFHELSMQPGTFHQLSSTFCIVGRSSVKCCQLSVWPRDLLSTFINILCGRETFRQLLSTFCAGKRSSVSFLCVWETSHHSSVWPGGLRQVSVQPLDIPSMSAKCLCCRETFR